MNYKTLLILIISFSVIALSQSYEDSFGYAKPIKKICQPELSDYFVIDAETGDLSQFTSTYIDPPGTEITAATLAKHTCSYGFSFDITDDIAGPYSGYALKNFTSSTEIIIRFYIYFSSQFNLNTAGNGTNHLLYTADQFDNELLSLHLTSEDPGSEIHWHLYFGETLLDTYIHYLDIRGTWQKIQVYYKADESNAFVSLWLNNEKVLQIENISSVEGMSQLRIGIYNFISTGTLNDYIYLDDLVGW